MALLSDRIKYIYKKSLSNFENFQIVQNLKYYDSDHFGELLIEIFNLTQRTIKNCSSNQINSNQNEVNEVNEISNNETSIKNLLNLFKIRQNIIHEPKISDLQHVECKISNIMDNSIKIITLYLVNETMQYPYAYIYCFENKKMCSFGFTYKSVDGEVKTDYISYIDLYNIAATINNMQVNNMNGTNVIFEEFSKLFQIGYDIKILTNISTKYTERIINEIIQLKMHYIILIIILYKYNYLMNITSLNTYFQYEINTDMNLAENIKQFDKNNILLNISENMINEKFINEINEIKKNKIFDYENFKKIYFLYEIFSDISSKEYIKLLPLLNDNHKQNKYELELYILKLVSMLNIDTINGFPILIDTFAIKDIAFNIFTNKDYPSFIRPMFEVSPFQNINISNNINVRNKELNLYNTIIGAVTLDVGQPFYYWLYNIEKPGYVNMLSTNTIIKDTLSDNNIYNFYNFINDLPVYLFDYAWKLSKLHNNGIIHGDTHLGNITLKYNQILDNSFEKIYTDNNLNQNKFELGRNNSMINYDNEFLIPLYNLVPNIIDFSRSFFINDTKKIIKYINRIIPDIYKQNKEYIHSMDILSLGFIVTLLDLISLINYLIVALKTIDYYRIIKDNENEVIENTLLFLENFYNIGIEHMQNYLSKQGRENDKNFKYVYQNKYKYMQKDGHLDFSQFACNDIEFFKTPTHILLNEIYNKYHYINTINKYNNIILEL